MPIINHDLCIGCGKCADVCGFDAIKIENNKAIADNKKCIGCGMCAFHCPVSAIKTKERTDEEKEKVIMEWAKSYAKKNKFNVNPDQKIASAIIKGLIMKEKKFGKRYCPCRIGNVDENVCPCIYHKEEIEKDGHCHCTLFVK